MGVFKIGQSVLVVFGFLFATTAPAERTGLIEVNGRVLASFDEDYAIIEAKDKMYRIKISELSFIQRQKAKRLLSEMTLTVPRNAIDLVWRLQPMGESVPVAELEAVDQLKSHDGIVEIVGKRLPTIPSDTAFIQVKDRIYVIQKDKVPPESRMRLEGAKVNAYIPQSSVLFSWRIESARPRQIYDERHVFERSGSNFKIVGRSIHSFEEPYGLVQSDLTIIQLARAHLTTDQAAQLDEPGKLVRMRVPEVAITHLWGGREKEVGLR